MANKEVRMQPIFGGLYFISDDGRLYSARSNKFLRSDRDRYGYLSEVKVNGTAENVTGTVAVAHGGTGATTAAAARTNLGIACTSLYSGTLTTGR